MRAREAWESLVTALKAFHPIFLQAVRYWCHTLSHPHDRARRIPPVLVLPCTLRVSAWSWHYNCVRANTGHCKCDNANSSPRHPLLYLLACSNCDSVHILLHSASFRSQVTQDGLKALALGGKAHHESLLCRRRESLLCRRRVVLPTMPRPYGRERTVHPEVDSLKEERKGPSNLNGA